MDCDINLRAEAGEVFVDRVVENLENAVVQPALVCRPDIHSRALADARQALQFVNFRSVVFFAFGGGFGVKIVWHGKGRVRAGTNIEIGA